MGHLKLLTPIIFVLLYSGLSVFISSLAGKYEETKVLGVTYFLSFVFLSCACSSLLFRYISQKRNPTVLQGISHRKVFALLVLVSFAGVIAVPYFLSLISFGPATTDWVEKGVTPLIFVLFGIFIAKEYPKPSRLLLLFFGFLGFLMIFLSSTKQTNRYLLFFFYTFMGALGSALSVFVMSYLARKGVNRFTTMFFRYALVGVGCLVYSIVHQTKIQFGSHLIYPLLVGVVLSMVLYLAIETIISFGSVTFGLIFLFIPVLETLWSYFFLGNKDKILWGLTSTVGVLLIFFSSVVVWYLDSVEED